jgi:hypothetical protein
MNLCIDLGDDSYTLKFKVLDTPIAQLWVKRMHLSLPDNVDHHDRFYGFNSVEAELERAEQQLKESVQVINAHNPIIHKPVDIHSQDCLNYLHNIFEVYHGLLDQQTHPYWVLAPDPVRKALAELNLNVHRAESATRNPVPRFVGTYYRLPKTETLTPELMNAYGETASRFGVVYLNYVEIGKTLEDLMEDDDQYISEDAFQPFNHYSSDFVVRMFDVTQSDMDKKINKMEQYYNKNKDFFVSKGYSEFNNPSLLPLKFPVAELIITKDRTQIIADISARQRITRVYFE